jgi:SHS family lactate transporter-like MFS transporter
MADGNRWRAFTAAFLGWMLDGYDFTILTLVLIEVQQELGMSSAEAGALGTVTLLTRLVGGAIGGRAADRWGRKLPLMISIVWFSIFSLLSGFSSSYWMLFVFRALFGLGMGAEWAAGMPLVLEHWPERLRGIVSGIVQGAFSWGFILAAAVVQFAFPLIADAPWGWRAMLWSGFLPALVVFWVRRSVPESPVWLAGKSAPPTQATPSVSVNGFPLWPALLLGAVMFAYQSVSFWYGTLIRAEGHSPLIYVAALNLGGIAGAAAWGAAAGTRLGATGAIATGGMIALASLPIFLMASQAISLLTAVTVVGFAVGGVIGVAPVYIANRFPARNRGWGGGIVYHSAAAAGAAAPLVIGSLHDAGWALRDAMSLCAAGATLAAIAMAVRERYTRGAHRDEALESNA